MAMRPRLRTLALTAHVVASVGWLGAIVAFLALAIVGLTSDDAQLVRAVYLTAEPLTWFVIVPAALASLVTGIVQSLVTTWGLFRHYWVVFKLVITVVATFVLLLYTETVGVLASVAAEPRVSYPGDPDNRFDPQEHGLAEGFGDLTACHDIGVFVELRLAGAPCAKRAQLWRIKRNGIPDTEHPLWVYDDSVDTDGPGGPDVAAERGTFTRHNPRRCVTWRPSPASFSS